MNITRAIKSLVAAFVVCGATFASLCAYAEEWTDANGLIWKYTTAVNSTETYAAIVGNGVYPVSAGRIVETGAIAKGTTGDLTIPSSINGVPVRTIGQWAFAYCRQLTSVTIPDTVTTIEDGAFASCSGMKRVFFGANVRSVGSCAFLYCTSLNFVTLPKDAELGASSFGGCESLRLLTADSNFSSGCHGVFGFWVGGLMLDLIGGGGVDMDPLWDCTAISCIELGEGVTSVTLSGFGNGPNLRSIICKGKLPVIAGVNIDYGKTICYVLRKNYSDGLPSETWAGMELRYLEGDVPADSKVADFEIQEAALGTAGGSSAAEIAFDGDDDIVFSYKARERWGIVGVDGQVVNRITIMRASDGGEVGVYDDVVEEVDGDGAIVRTGVQIPALANLQDGEYVLRLDLNVDNVVSETYYENNTTSIAFRVGLNAPTPEPKEVYGLYADVDGAAPTDAASEYNGYLYDENSGAVKGTIQVKVGKPGKKDGKASVKATVIVGKKKVTLKAKDKGKAVIEKDGPTEIELVGGEACSVVLGEEGVSGTYGAYLIDGSRNFFAAKSGGEAANAVLGKWLGPVNVVWGGGSVNVAIAKKGKARVKGTLASGAKVSATAVFLVGEEWCAVPVAAPKADLAFTLWLSRDGRTAVVDGLGDGAIAGKPGVLGKDAAFHVSKAAALWSSISGTVLTDYIPDGVEVSSKGGKWALPRAGNVVYKNGSVDESKLGKNPSGLKLTYKAKDGSFKGSFKVYAVNGGKAKATTVSVTGVMVGTTGYGTATVKGKGSVKVTIE